MRSVTNNLELGGHHHNPCESVQVCNNFLAVGLLVLITPIRWLHQSLKRGIPLRTSLFLPGKRAGWSRTSNFNSSDANLADQHLTCTEVAARDTMAVPRDNKRPPATHSLLGSSPSQENNLTEDRGILRPSSLTSLLYGNDGNDGGAA